MSNTNVVEGGVNAEYPTRFAMIRATESDATGYVECWDKNGMTLPHSDGAAEALITISSVGRSVAQFLYTNGNTSGVNRSVTGEGSRPGFPNGTVGGRFRLVSGAVAYNNSGNTTGGTSGGTGIDSASAAPTANSPNILNNIGGVLQFGMYRNAAGMAIGASGGGSTEYTQILEAGSLSISTTIKYVLGSATWTSLSNSSGVDKFCVVTNCDASLPAYFALLSTSQSAAGAVSTTLFNFKLAAGESASVFVPNDYDLITVRGSSGGAVAAVYYGVG